MLINKEPRHDLYVHAIVLENNTIYNKRVGKKLEETCQHDFVRYVEHGSHRTQYVCKICANTIYTKRVKKKLKETCQHDFVRYVENGSHRTQYVCNICGFM